MLDFLHLDRDDERGRRKLRWHGSLSYGATIELLHNLSEPLDSARPERMVAWDVCSESGAIS